GGGGGGTGGTWVGAAATNWTAGGSWSSGGAPVAGDAATFDGAIGGNSTNMDAAGAAGTLNFSNAAGHTISGSGTLTLGGGSGAGINATAGSSTISAPVALSSALAANIAGGAKVSLGNLQASSQTIAKSGGGELEVNNLRSGAVSITGGKVTVTANGGAAGTSKVAGLSISGAGAKLDLKDNDLVVQGGSLASVRSLIQSGYAAGAWSGDGIVTTGVAPAGKTAGLGYGQATAGGTLSGESFAAGDTLVKFTYLGDADIDGDVDGVDVGFWAGNFTGAGGSSSKLWAEGDWDYDGDVDGVDVGFWAGNFTGAGGGVLDLPGAQPEAAAMLESMGYTVVPEPASLGLLAVAAMAMGRRRRK
ncbi:MAG TPA: PEP-CTERM sorting domain-containing protein, partial [Tepidisphaeraceae bacterium]|nr:PEP-CTERM sorting domain-containing protein [Tepidisphaeraceae bacterium]